MLQLLGDLPTGDDGPHHLRQQEDVVAGVRVRDELFEVLNASRILLKKAFATFANASGLWQAGQTHLLCDSLECARYGAKCPRRHADDLKSLAYGGRT